MADDVKEELINEPDTGNSIAEPFTTERIKSGKLNLWSPMKKRQLKTWRMAGKKVRVTTGDKIVELQEDRSLFAQMFVISESRRVVDLQETVSRYEFSVVPRSMFAIDGTMFKVKSNLMTVLEQLPAKENADSAGSNDGGRDNDASGAAREVVIIDGMAEVQCLVKPDWIQNCCQLASKFTGQLLERYSNTCGL